MPAIRRSTVLILAATTFTLALSGCIGVPAGTEGVVLPPTSDASTVKLDFEIPDDMDPVAFMDTTLDFELQADAALQAVDLGYLDGNEIGEGQYSLYFYGPDSTSMWEVIQPPSHELPIQPFRAYLSDDPIQEPMLVPLD